MSGILGIIQNQKITIVDFENILNLAVFQNHAIEITIISNTSAFDFFLSNTDYTAQAIDTFKKLENKDFKALFISYYNNNKSFNKQSIIKDTKESVIAIHYCRNYNDNKAFTKNKIKDSFVYQEIKNSNNTTCFDERTIQPSAINNSDETFILFNVKELSVQIYRNYYGKGNIYYYHDNHSLLFCSKINPLKHLKRKQCPVNYAHWSKIIINERLAAGITNETIYKNIYQVMPGEIITVKNFELNKNSLPPISIQPNKNSINYNTHILKDKFVKSFEQCINNKSPFGISLSGGLDSACIIAAAYINKHRHLNTFSVSFDNNPSMDTHYIKLINDFYQCNANIINHADFDFFQLTDEILKITEQPFYDSGAIGHYLVLQKAAANGIITLLDGEGAEIAAGPDDGTDFLPYFNELFIKMKWFNFLKNYNFFKPYGIKSWIKILIKKKLGMQIPSPIQWMNPDFYEQYYFEDQYNAIYQNDYKAYNLDGLYLDYIPHAMSCKCKLADAFEIDYQFPFLNESFLSYALGIPEEQKVSPPFTKYILRKAFENELPKEVFMRKDKMVYSGPSLAPYLNNDGEFYKTTLNIIKNSQLCKQKILIWEQLQKDLYPKINVRLLNLCRMYDLFLDDGSSNKNW